VSFEYTQSLIIIKRNNHERNRQQDKRAICDFCSVPCADYNHILSAFAACCVRI